MLLSVLRILSTASSITTRIQQAQSRNFDSEPAISLTHRCWVFKFSRGGICACPVLLSVLAVSVPARSSSGNVISPYPLKAFLVSQRKGKGLSGRRKGAFLMDKHPRCRLSFSLPINSRLRITAACSTATSPSRGRTPHSSVRTCSRLSRRTTCTRCRICTPTSRSAHATDASSPTSSARKRCTRNTPRCRNTDPIPFFSQHPKSPVGFPAGPFNTPICRAADVKPHSTNIAISNSNAHLR